MKSVNEQDNLAACYLFILERMRVRKGMTSTEGSPLRMSRSNRTKSGTSPINGQR
jgi:hypothetical protein